MQDSKIEWTNHTFNPWWGCMKVSEGCKNCYAQIRDNRFNHADPHWGPNSPRKPMSDAHWKDPFKWDKAAELAGVKAKVFCASMADVFEGTDTLKHYESQLMVADARLRLFQTIATTPNLIWQLLTKRPENIMDILDSVFGPLQMHDYFEDGNKEYLAKYKEAYKMLGHWLNGNAPANVWIGTSVENQKTANERIPYLLNVPATIRFLSCEPLLEKIDLTDIYYGGMGVNVFNGVNDCWEISFLNKIEWVICGGESGHNARPMHIPWVRSIRNQCKKFNVPFFFKQWGEYAPDENHVPHNIDHLYKVGKKVAGCLLDGVEHKESPI